MQEKNAKAYIMMITSVLIFGTIGIFRKYIPLSSEMLAFSRGLLGSIFLLIFIAVTRRRPKRLGGRKLLWLAVTGAIIGLNWMLLFEAYRYTTVATATMCYYMQPTIVILLSPVFFKEKLTAKKLICAAAAVVGMLFVSGMAEEAQLGAQDIKGILCGLGAAALYAAVIIMNKKVQMDDSYQKTMVQLAGAALVLVPRVITAGIGEIAAMDATAVVLVLVVGIVHTGIAYVLYFGSMQSLKAQSVAVLSYIDPVFALILSAAVLHESLSPLGLAGAVLIIGSALVSEIDFNKRV